MNWTVHVLNAQGQLDGFVDPILGAIERVRVRAETVTDPTEIDVVVQIWPNRVIPERGHTGYAPTAP